MKITEHPPVHQGGITTYTVHIETEEDAALLRKLEREGVGVEVLTSAFDHTEKGKDNER